MRSRIDAEQAFITQLVEKTRQIVTSSTIDLPGKLAAIQPAIRKNSLKLLKLKRAKARARTRERNDRLEGIIALRERSKAYLVATVKFVVHSEKSGLSLQQRPRMFAYPDWDVVTRRRKPDPDPIPFMEFSS